MFLKGPRTRTWLRSGMTSFAVYAALILPTHADLRSEEAGVDPLPSTSMRAHISGQHYASETAPNGRVELEASLRSSRQFELHFYSFFETDSNGDKSFDLDSTLMRLEVSPKSHFWLGRVLPFQEGFAGDGVAHTSAIGTRWMQNQSNPLQPRLGGWIGMGAHLKMGESGFYFTGNYSPIFLPSFGPSIEFSETVAAAGPRFARLPPSRIDLYGQKLPLRFRIDAGDVRHIVLQPQYFAEIGHDLGWQRFSFIGWSAPSPSPVISASGVLKVTANDASILATVNPSFPRESFYGLRWLTRGFWINPEIQAIREIHSRSTTLSASMTLGNFLEAGYLTTITTDPPKKTIPEEAPSVNTPEYAHHLAWCEMKATLLKPQLTASLRAEAHLTPGQKDQWLRPMMRYELDSRTSLFAAASIITGTDQSYLGTWRSLDALSFGGQYRW